jgi:ABC-type nitrate/sulfonate/bicarbonate transport system ATPase subunit
VFQFIWTMNDFMGPLIYLSSVENYPVSLALKMSIGATEEVEWSNVIAISVVALIPSVAVFFARKSIHRRRHLQWRQGLVMAAVSCARSRRPTPTVSRPCTASTSTCVTASSWSSSVPRAAPSPRCCAWSRAWNPSPAASCTSAAAVNDLPPSARGIAMVFQNYALYPHMTVYDNLAFGLKLAKTPKAELDQRVRHAAQLLEMEHLLERYPKQLSGGQAQRVAVGRAIVKKPEVFLFDEPLSNLDAKLRAAMRVRLTELHRSLRDAGQPATTIYVTHDQTEAMTMGERICVLKAGVIQQVDTPTALYDRPANAFVASFIGSPEMNIVRPSARAMRWCWAACNWRCRPAASSPAPTARCSSACGPSTSPRAQAGQRRGAGHAEVLRAHGRRGLHLCRRRRRGLQRPRAGRGRLRPDRPAPRHGADAALPDGPGPPLRGRRPRRESPRMSLSRRTPRQRRRAGAPFVHAQERPVLRFAWWGGASRHQATLAALKVFEQRHGVRVKAEYMGFNGYLERLTTQIAGRSEPDVMQINWAWLAMFSKRGNGFTDLNSVAKELRWTSSAKTTSPTAAWPASSTRCPPFSARVFLWNQTAFGRAGLAARRPGTSSSPPAPPSAPSWATRPTRWTASSTT